MIGQQRKKQRTQASGHHIPSLMDVQVTGVNLTKSTCWPPVGRCASYGIEGYRRFRAPCIVQGRWCDKCGLQGHFAQVCTKELNLHMKSHTNREETTSKLGRHWKASSWVQIHGTRPTPAPKPSRRGVRIQQINVGRDNRCLRTVSLMSRTPFGEANMLQQESPKQELRECATIEASVITRQKVVNPANFLVAALG